MAVINTGLLTKGLRSEFFNRFEQTQAHVNTLATRIPSNSDSETYRWLGTVPQMREWGQGRLTQGMRAEQYSLENLKYEATIEVDRDEISDDQTGQIRVRVAELAQRAATHKDYLIAQLLINGDQSGYESYDGATFFSTTHSSGASGTQSNTVNWNVASTTFPTAEEFRDSVRNAMASMLAFKDDQGEPMAISETGMVVVTPPQTFFAALEGINSTLVNNLDNVLQGAARVISLPWLTDPTVWYLLKTDGVIRPFVFQDREPIEFNALTEESDEGFRREKYLFGVRARYRIGFGYWQFAVQTTFV